jgi:hypothetical protein
VKRALAVSISVSGVEITFLYSNYQQDHFYHRDYPTSSHYRSEFPLGRKEHTDAGYWDDRQHVQITEEPGRNDTENFTPGSTLFRRRRFTVDHTRPDESGTSDDGCCEGEQNVHNTHVDQD